VFSPSDRLNKSPDLVLRRLPEWRQCYAYTPAQPDLYELNRTAWLIVELCDGQSLDAVEQAFLDSVGRKIDAETARMHFNQGLADLLARGILVRSPDIAGNEEG